MKISGNLIDIYLRNIYPATIWFEKGKIKKIERTENKEDGYILPGLIDSHVHIESSMLTPGAFAIACVPHGTIGNVSDPHEIANVMGMEGVEYMISEGEKVPVKFWFGAPACVPATEFESNGGSLGAYEIERLLKRNDIKFLAEMMNFPGVIYGNEEVWRKIEIAKKQGKKIDGHAPGLRGKDLKKYVSAGISTDHECSTLDEAKEKISLGMKILIREGSAARNLDGLKELYNTNPGEVMLCSDDLHPEMLMKRHINKLIAKLICEGYNKYDVIKSATINPCEHYGLDAGLLKTGQNADFIVVDRLEEMNVTETWIDGVKVFDRRKVLFRYKPGKAINKFNCKPITSADVEIKNLGKKLRIIKAFDGKLLTKEINRAAAQGEIIEPILPEDILKIVVKDRYNDSPAATGLIKGFGLKVGAFASSIAHDSHNIISVGTNDKDIVCAINEVIRLKGGLAVSKGKEIKSIQLNVAGIMSDHSCGEIAADYESLSALVREMGCTMSAPFMTLSFMALLVIPEIKMSDRGLFDGKKFCHVPLFVE